MKYQLKSLYSSDRAFNGDVIADDEEKYMGRLYILVTEDSQLLNVGIKKEWFLAHASLDSLICGHINIDGEWSLSPYRSLEPSLTYCVASWLVVRHRNQIFDQVFSSEFVCEIAHLRQEEIINISEIIKSSDDSNNGQDDNTNSSSEIRTNKIIGNITINPDNLNLLKDLILHSPLDELVVEEQEDRIDELQRETASKLDEGKLVFLQIDLIEKIEDEYKQHLKTEFIFVPFGNVTVHEEDNYFVLSDSEDGHNIFIATFDDEIIQGLSEHDAIQVEVIINQIDREGDRTIQSIAQQEKEVDQENQTVQPQPGMEYGT
ncbi:hypothetical protein [Calothrix sp. UHCC 0171]|uniref:hypothetical protein n=1 Tax=Calothrix sp. UHCC 0171 TaxID=3110245 RepID=UPI002B1EF694|nr:hypothetical protein [Calothrix sp. UHCC 0171]MEA5574805.1 hypothetical protein [Calothrix sp. UHCC 0171]